MIYRQLLDHEFDRLPPALRCLHSIPASLRASGTVSVRHRRPWLARLVGFPVAGDNIPLRLEVATGAGREIWTRRFGEDVHQSVQRLEEGLLVEEWGPLRLRLRVFADSAGLHLESLSARVWRLPIPLRVKAVERAHGDGWEFEVQVSPVGSYRGAMELLP